MTITAIQPITAGITAQEQAHRAAYVAGLRVLAAALEAHDEVPLPYDGDSSAITIHFLAGADPRAAMAAAARALPCSWRKDVRDYGERGGGAYFDLHGELAGLKVTLTARRDDVCERAVTGTREVVELVRDPALLDAVPLVEVTRVVEDVEWTCGSVLAPAAGEPS